MRNLYFGKSKNLYYLYLDPISIDLLEFTRNSNYVICNELHFDGASVNPEKKSVFTLPDFRNLIQSNNSIVEFNLITDNKTHIQNIWWDDLLIISDFVTIINFTNEIRAKLNSIENSYLDLMLSKPNTYFTISNKKIENKYIGADNIISFIKDSERYLEKESKFI